MCEKLDEFLEQGITVPVEEPMDWVSSLTYSWKANGKLRVCLDPGDVKAINGHHYKIPTIEEISHQLAGSKMFTKVDGTSSYLYIVLDYASSLLTMFNTPWGRCRFIHLPWGLTCARDIFQWMMDQILECHEGAIAGCQLDFVKKKVFLKGLIFKKKGFCNKKKGFPCQMDSFLIPAKGFFTSCILK